MVKILILLNNQVIISKIEEVGSELGEPDCKLINPFIVKDNSILEPWISSYTIQSEFMIHSDKILTIADPREALLEKYEKLIK